jgi:hypothetical protein
LAMCMAVPFVARGLWHILKPIRVLRGSPVDGTN